MARKFDTFEETFALVNAGMERASERVIVRAITKDVSAMDARLSSMRAQLSVILWTMGLGFAVSLSLEVIILMRRL